MKKVLLNMRITWIEVQKCNLQMNLNANATYSNSDNDIFINCVFCTEFFLSFKFGKLLWILNLNFHKCKSCRFHESCNYLYFIQQCTYSSIKANKFTQVFWHKKWVKMDGMYTSSKKWRHGQLNVNMLGSKVRTSPPIPLQSLTHSITTLNRGIKWIHTNLSTFHTM